MSVVLPSPGAPMTMMHAALFFFSRSTASDSARMGGPHSPDGSVAGAAFFFSVDQDALLGDVLRRHAPHP